jgi:formylglycine-generating enzyme required for sulfatase activity
MNDVFISYSSYDYLIAGIMYDRLKAAGFTVWWDQRITPGEPYKDEIMTELNNAKAVVVVWTPDAVNSEWVQKEARRAIQLRKYVPLMYRCENVPEDYRALQYIEVTRWNADPEHHDFRKVVTGIKDIIASHAQRQDLQQLSVSVTDRNGGQTIKTFRPFQTFRDYSGPTLVVIPSGRFFMGSAEGPEAEKDAERFEHPQHLVVVAKPFAIAKFPVTIREWLAATKSEVGPKHAPPTLEGADNFPVTCVNWNDADRYAEWLSGLTGQRYRLPSEAQWEYVCRGGTHGPFGIPELSLNSARYDARGVYMGSRKPTKSIRASDVHLTNVTACATNNFNVSGMHGNVWEWTQDHWHDSYSGDKPTDGTAWEDSGPREKKLHRVVRGGSYKSLPQHLRSAQRAHRHPRHRQPTVGFRLARDLTPE